MGLLDDAIREHLDLKRRRGADPTEIEREEAEALGPVRRDASDEPASAEAEGSYADAPVDDRYDRFSTHEPAALDEPGAAYDDDQDAPPAFADELTEPHLPAPTVPSEHDAPYPEREEDSATPPHGDPLLHQQTREFSATELDQAQGHDEPGDSPPPSADVVPADEEPGEDELEETPEFLQETPEHDRLWFEQKPPKDFDF